jgi:cystathionine beta-lyase/cystathionine gamma-synthase
MLDYEGKFAPGFMVYFILKGVSPEESRARGMRMMDYIAENSYTITLAVSLGQIRTLIEHPGSMTHSAYSAEEQIKRGLDPGGIRLAVGIEQAGDVIRDLEAALEHCR